MQNLFGETITTKPLKRSKAEKWKDIQRKIDYLWENVADDWKREVIRFAVNIYLPNRKGNWLAQDMRKAYDSYALGRGLPVTMKPEAFSGVMRHLRKHKLVETAKPNPRDNFVLAISYRSLI